MCWQSQHLRGLPYGMRLRVGSRVWGGVCALWAIIHVEHAQAWGLRGGGASAGELRPYGGFMVYHHARQRRRYVALL